LLEVQLVSPERLLYTGEATMVVCRTVGAGDIAFLTGHVSFIGALAIHPVRIRREDGGADVVAVHGGFVELSSDRVSILSDVAELADQIDVDRARHALERAEEQLRQSPDDEEALAARDRASTRLQVAGAA
jgi:F-type H+-transporting ATPase subunit epsilon